MTKIRHKAKVAKQLPVLMSGFAQFRSYDSYLSHLNPMILCVKNVTLKQDLERCFFFPFSPQCKPPPRAEGNPERATGSCTSIKSFFNFAAPLHC